MTRSWTGMVCLLGAWVLAGCSGGAPADSPETGAAPAQQRLLAATPAAFAGHGTWWNPAEPGSGFVFEAQGATGVITYFTYEAGGKPVWYSGAGSFGLNAEGKYAFSATLYRYAGGQPATSSTPKAPTRTEVGATTVVFDGNSAQVQIPGRSYTASKFNTATASSPSQPEAGIYWNAGESGRGYTIEVANNTVSIGVFHYDADGQPTWNLVVGDLSSGRLSAAFTSYTGGQPFGGAYRPPQTQATTQQFQANFGAACSGSISFPGMGATAVTRFPFGGLPGGAECRVASLAASCTPGIVQGYARNIELSVADAGFAGGGDGGGGDGGGAAAGGGLGKVLGGLMRVQDLSDGSTLGEAVTDGSQGLVTVKTCARTGPFLLSLEGRAGAKYFDEGLSQLSDFGPGNVLHALVDRWNEHVGVSPLTEAAFRYALNNFKAGAAEIAAGRAALRADGSLVGLTHEQVRQANAKVLTEVNARLPDAYVLPSPRALPTPFDAGSGLSALPDSRYGRAAAVNGGLVQLSRFHNPANSSPALRMTEDLARDFTDGRIDGFALDGSQIARAEQVSYESVRLPLGSAIGTNAITSRFSNGQLKPAVPRIEEEAWVLADGTSFQPREGVDCAAFRDDVALLSDGSVSVVRHFPTNVNGVCRYRFDAAESARDQKLMRFLTDVVSLAVGQEASFALKRDGTVVGWGDNYCGRLSPQLPNGLYLQPQVIAGLRNVTSIRSESTGTVARDSTGSVFYWAFKGAPSGTVPAGHALCDRGANSFQGQLIDHVQPTTISKLQLSNIVDVATSNGNFFALTADGKVYGWGTGAAGLLANSDGTVQFDALGGDVLRAPEVTEPTLLPLSGVRQLAFVPRTVFALHADGTVSGWGDDYFGMLGYGTQTRTTRPTRIAELTGITTLAGGNDGIRALRSDGAVLAWTGKVTSETLKWGSPLYTQPLPRPAVLQTPERIRHIVPRAAGYSVFFASGKVGRDVNGSFDVSDMYR